VLGITDIYQRMTNEIKKDLKKATILKTLINTIILTFMGIQESSLAGSVYYRNYRA